ncbi:tetratricopeptide repeat protein [Streptomyces sp. NPDC048277]|uniref:tetratricopeptide repeat protein n=1 Tax=Streptomyces sp. NPDC048277 TaxID=3155027 RepID=UPI0033E99BDA
MVLLGVSGGGAVAALVASVWLSATWTAAVAAVAAAVAGVFADEARTSLLAHRQQRHAIAARAGQLTVRAQRVRDSVDPISLGVHPAASRRNAGRRAERVPAFVERDRFNDVVRRIGEGGFVLIVGDSTAGKSRLAYEAMRVAVPDFVLVQARASEDLHALSCAVGAARHCVVWLDEFDQFLRAGGITLEMVEAMLAGPERQVVLLASMRSKEYDRYSARQRDVTDAATWRAGREVLLRAGEPIELDRLWSQREVGQAQAADHDPRLKAAAQASDRFGVAEVLAAGPELLSDWIHAWQAGDHPRGAALVAAAVDCRRMGFHQPVGASLLLALHERYLSARGGALLRPEPFEDALSWATTPVQGASSLLLPGHGGYLAFDYLIDLPGLSAIPETSWEVLLAAVAPQDAFDVGWAAVDLMRPSVALEAFDTARRHGVPDADYAHAIALGNAGQPLSAVRLLRELHEYRDAQLGSDHPDTLATRHDIARYLAEAGRLSEAVTLLDSLALDRQRVLGSRHMATLVTLSSKARFLRDSGNAPQALRLFRQLLPDMTGVLGADHVDVLLARQELGRTLGHTGRVSDALACIAEVLEDQERVLGAAHPHTLSTRFELALLVARSGDLREAIGQLQAVLDDQERILGLHSRTLSTRHQLGKLLALTGETEQAREVLAEVLRDQERYHGPSHPRTLATRYDQFLVSRPTQDPQEAASVLAALQEDCRRVLGSAHPLTQAVVACETT